MLKVTLFTFFLLFFGNIAFAQPPQSTNTTEISFRQATPYEHIKALQQGVLLVRLKTAKNKIDALNKMGKTQWAQRIIREQRAENQKLVDAFAKYYTFSPVYFFFSDDSDKILQKQFAGVLYDHKLQPAFENTAFQNKFLVAEIALVAQNPIPVGQQETNASKQSDNQNSTFEGLVISDENLKQLSDPFPYYVRSFESLGKKIARSEARMVQKMNQKLIEFSKISPSILQNLRYTGRD